MPRRWLLLGMGAGLAGALGCSDDAPQCAARVVEADVSCDTTQQCVDEGYQGLSCVGGTCRRVCATDRDCRPQDDELVDEPEMCQAMGGALDNAICEAQLCQLGCPEVPCAAGETCVEGRCLYYFEGFEARGDDRFVNLEQIGYNGIETELSNVDTTVVFAGRPGCSRGDDDCAGPAGEGQRFVALERSVTRPKGTARTEATCRPCACCLECLFEPEDGAPPQLSSCPDDVRPSPLTCPSSTPARCSEVCTQCEACPDADMSRIGEGLVSCELPAAQKNCPSCLTCEEDKAACRAAMCPSCASEPGADACVQCVDANCLDSAACQSCLVCDDATQCLITDPDSAECAEKDAACRALGADGCFSAAVSYGRSQLEDLEQALVSPEVDLSEASGEVVLELLHVPFDIGETYRPGIQGTPPEQWPIAPQRVRIELCGGRCAEPSSWRLGELVGGGEAILPSAARRNNGLLLGSQTPLDWQGGQVRVRVPADLFSSGFRFRFVPDIAEDTRLGIDAVRVRRLR